MSSVLGGLRNIIVLVLFATPASASVIDLDEACYGCHGNCEITTNCGVVACPDAMVCFWDQEGCVTWTCDDLSSVGICCTNPE